MDRAIFHYLVPGPGGRLVSIDKQLYHKISNSEVVCLNLSRVSCIGLLIEIDLMFLRHQDNG